MCSCDGSAAAQVDPATLQFGSAEASPVDLPVIADIDGEFGSDTEVRFKVAESGIFCNDTEVWPINLLSDSL